MELPGKSFPEVSLEFDLPAFLNWTPRYSLFGEGWRKAGLLFDTFRGSDQSPWKVRMSNIHSKRNRKLEHWSASHVGKVELPIPVLVLSVPSTWFSD